MSNREIIILDCNEIKCPLVLQYVFNELCGYFTRNNYVVKTINNLDELHDNSVVFMGNIFNCTEPANLLNLYAPNAIYIGWYWQNINTSLLKYFIYTYENSLNIYYDKTRINDFIILTTSKNNVPLLLRANDNPQLIGTYARNICYDYCYMGYPYCLDMVPSNKFNGIYYAKTDFTRFLNYKTRKNIYLSSIFALGFQSNTNIGYKHVSQRIFEGLAYGCIVLSNSLPACEQTNNIVIHVSSKADLENKMQFYKNNPEKIIEKQIEGYEFVKKNGTNHTSIQKFSELIKNNFKIII